MLKEIAENTVNVLSNNPLQTILLNIVLTQPVIALDPDCSNLYEQQAYSAQEFSLCNAQVESQEVYGGQQVADDTLLLEPDHEFKACEHADGGDACQTFFPSSEAITDSQSDSLSYVQLTPFNDNDFYMAFMSDPQYPWSCKSSNENCSDRNKAWQENMNHVQSLNALQNDMGKEQFAGVVINGDLTAFGHGWQLDAYYELYHRNLQMNIFPGLGNHDVGNNVNDCFENSCANRMVFFLKDHVNSLNVRSFDYHDSGTYYHFPSLRRRYGKSFAYSWDMGDMHFVQLNNYPTYSVSWNGWNFGKARRDYIEIHPAREWLINDLEQATKEGKHIILNYHISEFTPEIKDILRRFKVSAIFAGHLHSKVGLFNFHTLWNFYGPGQHLPVFLGGSAVFQRYLLVRFLEDKFEVSIVNSQNGADYQLFKEGVYPLY